MFFTATLKLTVVLQEKIRPSPIPGSQLRVLSSVDDVKKILQNRLKISSVQFNLSVSSKWEEVAQALISCSRVRHYFYRDSLHPARVKILSTVLGQPDIILGSILKLASIPSSASYNNTPGPFVHTTETGVLRREPLLVNAKEVV